MLHKIIYLAALLLVCGYALWRGGKPERQGALIMIFGSLLSVPAAAAVSSLWSRPEYGLLTIDILVFALLVALSLRSDRFWPLWMTGFQATSVAIHLATMTELVVVSKAYAMAQGFWAYPMLTALLMGSLNHHRLHQPARLH
jgi:hypothetical protein